MSCPICQRPTRPEYRPFCSKRCADVDLGKWLTGRYVIPATEGDDEADGEMPEPKPPHDQPHHRPILQNLTHTTGFHGSQN